MNRFESLRAISVRNLPSAWGEIVEPGLIGEVGSRLLGHAVEDAVPARAGGGQPVFSAGSGPRP